MDKDVLVMDNHKKQNSSMKVTCSYLIDNLSKEDVQKLQKEIQHILLFLYSSSIKQNKILKKCDKEVV